VNLIEPGWLMDNNTAKKRIYELIKLIEHHNHQYYDEDSPEISDYEYDALTIELRRLEQEFPELVKSDSPARHVGGTAKRELRKVQHDVPMISLQDVFSQAEIYSFVNKMIEDLDNPTFVVEKKIDGISVALRYENGKLVEGITRGDGIIGESVYENLLVISSVPKAIPAKLNYLEVRGEVYMSGETFERVNARQEEIGGKIYQTARNLAAGSLRQLDSKVVKERHLDFFVFNLQAVQGMNFFSHAETLRWLVSQGFPVIPGFVECKTGEEVWNVITQIGESRGKLSYGIDGAVVKIDNLADRERMGSTSKVPRWAVAYKYPPEEKETILENIQIQVGRTGKLTPAAIFKPIKLAGTTVSRATLHNQDIIDSKDIRIGDTIVVRKAGDVIPEVLRSIPERRLNNAVRFQIPDRCPVCHAPAARDENGVDIRCTGSECPAQGARLILYFASKDAMDIDGLGPAALEALLAGGYLKSIADIYYLKDYRDELIANRVIGKEKSTDNLLAAIEGSKDNDIDRLITGFGIRNIGRQTAKVLAANFSDVHAVASATYDQLINLPDFGDTSVRAVLDYFAQDQTKNLLSRLEPAGVNMKSKALDSIKDQRFEGMTFVLTGTLPMLTREQASELIQLHGGNVSGSVSTKTTYVLAGEDAGSKLAKARSIGIKIISEADLIGMLSEPL
jgi:DNA ligase (NAD+)